MFKSRPLLLIVLTLCLSLVCLGAYWVAYLPQRTLQNLSSQLLANHGVVLEAQKASMGFSKGFTVVLDDVSLASKDSDRFSLTSASIDLNIGLTGLLGVASTTPAITVQSPVIGVDITDLPGFVFSGAPLALRDATIRLRDGVRGSVVSIADVNGTLTPIGTDSLRGRFVLPVNGQSTQLEFDIENVTRLGSTGSPADINMSSKDLLFGFSGRMQMAKMFKLDGQMNAEGKSFKAMLVMLGMPLSVIPDDAATTAQSGLSVDGLHASITYIDAKVGASNIKGNLTFAIGQDRPVVEGTLEADTLVLWPGSAVNLTESWRETPLPLSDLRVMDGTVTIKAGVLKVLALTTGPADVSLAMKDGKTTLTAKSADLAGGSLDLTAKIEPDGAEAKLGLTLNLSQVKADTVLQGLFGLDVLSGSMDAKLGLVTRGANSAALISSLGGGVEITGKTASLIGIDLSARFAKPGEGWGVQESAQTEGINFSWRGTVADGIVTLEAGDVVWTGGTLKPKGEIDLLRQALDLSVSPKQTLKGPWARPQISAPTAN
jgi:hypothetical protein